MYTESESVDERGTAVPAASSFFAALRGGGHGDGYQKKRRMEEHHAVSALYLGSLDTAAPMRRHRGSLTVEASLLMILILSVMGGMVKTSLELMQRVESQAAAAEEEAAFHYEERMAPEDVIRLSLFIREWIPKKG